MTSLVVVFPKAEDARNIRRLLMRGGYDVAAVCTSGAQALSAADRLGSGIMVCGYRYPDMLYTELFENLPSSFGMLLVASPRVIGEGVADGVASVTMPLHAAELFESLDGLETELVRRRRKRRTVPLQRTDREKQVIQEAKEMLMEKNGISEEEAHRYLQKTSMDSGTNLVETAQMVLALMRQ